MDKNVRIGFIRKVYGIVSVQVEIKTLSAHLHSQRFIVFSFQLTVTFAVLAFFMFYVGGGIRCTNRDPGW